MFAPDHTTFFVTGSHVFITNHTFHTLPLLTHPRPFFSSSCIMRAHHVGTALFSCVDAPKRPAEPRGTGVDQGPGHRAQVHLRCVHHPRPENKGRCILRVVAAVQRAPEPLQPPQGVQCVRAVERVCRDFSFLVFLAWSDRTNNNNPAGRPPNEGETPGSARRQTQAGYLFIACIIHTKEKRTRTKNPTKTPGGICSLCWF